MNADNMTYQALPFPMERQVTIQGGRLADIIRLCNMELRPIFTPVHQGHQELIGTLQF